MAAAVCVCFSDQVIDFRLLIAAAWWFRLQDLFLSSFPHSVETATCEVPGSIWVGPAEPGCRGAASVFWRQHREKLVEKERTEPQRSRRPFTRSARLPAGGFGSSSNASRPEQEPSSAWKHAWLSRPDPYSTITHHHTPTHTWGVHLCRRRPPADKHTLILLLFSSTNIFDFFCFRKLKTSKARPCLLSLDYVSTNKPPLIRFHGTAHASMFFNVTACFCVCATNWYHPNNHLICTRSSIIVPTRKEKQCSSCQRPFFHFL